ncbi:leucyl/phenylalanyl-tRNA--protein transferase [Paraglaciecola sp. L3A3]|uniref:leucyl/phenylalanyl-tRNA--protein transferase n=1 Tax=Paraglaciecola sp. L3A3 TaxID=2686358 RepID=UPI00131C02B5|nr:leucyl/phenylalanyl-tRNA--protein transferase [Paraglaciecola sp. L3A3]
MLTLTQLDKDLIFPRCEYALDEPNGLLAFGGDLSVARLIKAYKNGVFPWYSQGEPILWWSPDPRGILLLDEFKCSKSLAKFSRNCDFQISVNMAFDQVIDSCANVPRNDSGTWITAEMIQAYKNLHNQGHAHSIEIWHDQELIGGLYGVAVGKVFCGESMFHTVTNASKLAMLNLVKLLKADGAVFIDCQMQNPHLASLGCMEIPREHFLAKLKQQTEHSFSPSLWRVRYLEPQL